MYYDGVQKELVKEWTVNSSVHSWSLLTNWMFKKGNTRSKRISDIRKLYIKFLTSFTDLSNKEIANLLEIESSTVTNILDGRYKENDFIIKLSMEIDKNVKL